MTLERVATLALEEQPTTQDWLVGGDIAPSGAEILLKSYRAVYYWTRAPGQTVPCGAGRPPHTAPLSTRTPQGEALGWKRPDGTGYYTVSEERNRIPARVYFYSTLAGHRSRRRDERVVGRVTHHSLLSTLPVAVLKHLFAERHEGRPTPGPGSGGWPSAPPGGIVVGVQRQQTQRLGLGLPVKTVLSPANHRQGPHGPGSRRLYDGVVARQAGEPVAQPPAGAS